MLSFTLLRTQKIVCFTQNSFVNENDLMTFHMHILQVKTGWFPFMETPTQVFFMLQYDLLFLKCLTRKSTREHTFQKCTKNNCILRLEQLFISLLSKKITHTPAAFSSTLEKIRDTFMFNRVENSSFLKASMRQ